MFNLVLSLIARDFESWFCEDNGKEESLLFKRGNRGADIFNLREEQENDNREGRELACCRGHGNACNKERVCGKGS